MMKKLFLFLLWSLSTLSFAQSPFGGFGGGGGGGQQSGSITLSTSVSKKKVQKGEKVDIYFDVIVTEGWHLYTTDYDCAPLPFELFFADKSQSKSAGKLKAINDKSKFEELFGCKVNYFEGKGRFVLPYTVQESGTISGTYEGQVCEDNGVCLMVNGNWSVDVEVVENPDGSGSGSSGTNDVTENPSETNSATNDKVVPDTEPDETENTTAAVDSDTANGCACNAALQELDRVKHSLDSVLNLSGTAIASGAIGECDLPRRAGWDDIVILGEKGKKSTSLWWFFWAAFLFGLSALLTPCVFPMIPMTVTFFTKQSSSKAQGITNAIIYGISIVAIYTGIGLALSKIGGVDAANALATGWINILFFAIFFIFALSFLGMFDITLPSGFINKIDAKGDKGGLIGIFFMAFTLALVSFSCTGPIVGTVIIESVGGGWLKPIMGMLGFSVALALPFTLFAIFPQWMNNMPKSGGWLNAVKVVLGILELAMGMKFLSNADLAYHWHLLDREIFLIIWIVLFGLMGLYLLGKIRLPHDSPIEKLSVSRFMVALLPLVFTVYMFQGLFGGDLKLLAGVIPPETKTEIYHGDAGDQAICETPMYGDRLHIAHGIQGYFDFRQAICCAKRQKKPIFVDFTGHGCANCRRMEENVWSDPAVLKRLKEDFVVASLYVDDRVIELPKDEQYHRKNDDGTEGDLITLMGKANFDLEHTKFGQAAQPYYFILGYNETESTLDSIKLNILSRVEGYNPDIQAFTDTLDVSKTRYKELISN